MELPIFNIIQIYFDLRSKDNCSNHPYVKHYDNSKASPEQSKWFENAVIADQLPHGGKYFGVWSHQAQSKIVKAGNYRFTFEQLEGKLERTDKTVITFHHNQSKLPIFHNQEGQKLKRMMDNLMMHMEYPYRVGIPVRCAIMQNHFLMKTEQYKHYVSELRKAMAYIEKFLPEANDRSPYKAKSPINYSYHTFLLERFASAYVHKHQLSFTYYKDIK